MPQAEYLGKILAFQISKVHSQKVLNRTPVIQYIAKEQNHAADLSVSCFPVCCSECIENMLLVSIRWFTRHHEVRERCDKRKLEIGFVLITLRLKIGASPC
jgi:hypothetical protein